jgi:hypothetical protein
MKSFAVFLLQAVLAAAATSGDFSVLTMNVAGLPAILQSNDVSGDKATNAGTIGSYFAKYNYDVIHVQEVGFMLLRFFPPCCLPPAFRVLTLKSSDIHRTSTTMPTSTRLTRTPTAPPRRAVPCSALASTPWPTLTGSTLRA